MAIRYIVSIVGLLLLTGQGQAVAQTDSQPQVWVTPAQATNGNGNSGTIIQPGYGQPATEAVTPNANGGTTDHIDFDQPAAPNSVVVPTDTQPSSSGDSE